ncbi:MAG: SDR family oxidoreductase [Actinobacteria bacterium]|nr:SDR family oxidoreductase [Actinomycetota bacterium]
MPDRDGMDQDRPVAIVTGGAGGLGSAFCRALGSRGFRAVPVDIKGTERVVDVTDISACRDLASELQPVVWINNAGILGAGSAIDQPDEIVSSVLAVNLSGVINGTRAALGVMSEIGRGWILNVGSLAAWAPTPGLAVYCASKHAVRAYTTTVAMEMAGSGIRLCTICPDGIWTPMLEEVLDEKAGRHGL